jgi:hypothetical protein
MDMIHEYVRERVQGRGRMKVGVMVGLVHNGVICTAFSKANIKAGDMFDKDEGFRIATARALGEMESPEIPTQLIRPMRELQMRCAKYFQQADLISTKGAYPKNISIVDRSYKAPVMVEQALGRCACKKHKPFSIEHFFNSGNISKDSLKKYIDFMSNYHETDDNFVTYTSSVY